MANTKVYRLVSYATGVEQPQMSVVSTGVKTSFIYPGKTEYSSEPDTLMSRFAARSETPPETPEDWLRVALQSGTYLSYDEINYTEELPFDTRVSEEETYYDGLNMAGSSPGKARELSDNIGELLTKDEELSEFFRTGSAPKEPEGMRDFVRMLLESEDALQYNPGLIPWLEGGEAPSAEMFDGLVFWPEEGTTNG